MKIKRWMKLVVIICVLSMLTVVPGMAQTGPNTLDYQGRLLDALGNPRDGETHCVRFQLCADSDCASPVWGYEYHAVTTASGPYQAGLFSATLGSDIPISPDLAFDYDNLFLEVAVSDMDSGCDGATYTVMTPRSPIHTGTFAQRSRRVHTIESDDDALIQVSNTGSGWAIQGTADSNYAGGVYGQGGWYGVYGVGTDPTGTAYGVYGTANGSNGYGVAGLASSTTGTTYGVYGNAQSIQGIGARGIGHAASGNNPTVALGVWGDTDSGIGVLGYTSSSDAGMAGVAGWASAGTGQTYGVYGSSSSNEGYGVYAQGVGGDLRLAGSTGTIHAQDASDSQLELYSNHDVDVYLDRDENNDSAFWIYDSNSVPIFVAKEDGSVTGPPVAVLQASRSLLWPGNNETTLSLAQSYDPAGDTLTYAFDPTGQGWGQPASYGSSATTVVSYTQSGNYLAAGWVQDSQGQYARAQAQVTMMDFMFTLVREEAFNLFYGSDNSLAMINGRPGIAYVGYDSTNGYSLEFISAANPYGDVWYTEYMGNPDDGGGLEPANPSLVEIDGRAAIAYYDRSTTALKYVRAYDDELGLFGLEWDSPLVLDGSGSDDVGASPMLAVVNGNPAIAYADDTHQDIRYIRAYDTAGSSWASPQTVVSAGDVSTPSLVIADGNPAIAYADHTTVGDGDLRYVRATDASGASWGSSVLVDDGVDAGRALAMVIADGNPAIAYVDCLTVDECVVKYVRAEDSAGASWGTPIVVGSVYPGSFMFGAATIGGYPAILWYAQNDAVLMYAQAQDMSGTQWHTPSETGGPVPYWGYQFALADINGRPGIAISDILTCLHFAIPRVE